MLLLSQRGFAFACARQRVGILPNFGAVTGTGAERIGIHIGEDWLMKPSGIVAIAALSATLSGCAGVGFGDGISPAKPAVANVTTTPQPIAPVVPVAPVQTQPLPPAALGSVALTQPAPTSPPGIAAPPQPAQATTPALPTGPALGGVLGGPIGASLTDADRQAAWNAQIAALDSGQNRSWRGARGVFGFVAPGAGTGGGCRAYTQTIYIGGRANRGQGVACKQADGTWKMTS